MRVAIYCRVSTTDQSCSRQERDLLEYANMAGYSAVIDDLWDEQRVSVAIAVSDEEDLQPEGENYTPDTQVQEQTLEELVKGIDLDTLQLRPARKICGKLGIQQKVNSKDAPLSWLRTQIKARLIEKPIEVAPLIQEVLKAS